MTYQIPKDTFTPETQEGEAGKSVLFMTADKTEDLEFFYPYYRFIEEGFEVVVATPNGGAFKAKNGYGLPNTRKISDVRAEDYDFLYIPGGKAPAELKKHEEALAIARDFVDQGKIVAAICHGPQVLAEAGLISGRRIAAFPEVENEIRQAGAEYVFEEAVADGQFVTGRWPGDLPQQVKKTLEAVRGAGAGAKQQTRAEAPDARR